MTYNEFGGLIGYNVETRWALSIYPEFAYAYRAYEGDFPLMNEARRDHRVVGSLSLVKTDLALFGSRRGFSSPTRNNFSNVKFYEYDRFSIQRCADCVPSSGRTESQNAAALFAAGPLRAGVLADCSEPSGARPQEPLLISRAAPARTIRGYRLPASPLPCGGDHAFHVSRWGSRAPSIRRHR